MPTDDIKLENQPIKHFVTFKETQVMLKKSWRGSIENMLKNKTLRFYPVSPNHGKARMIYRPDVEAMQKKEAEE